MIAKGNLHANGVKLVGYIMSAERGERVEYGGAHGFAFFGRDLRQAAGIMQRMADETTRCEKAWFHTQTRLAPGEQLAPEQWEIVRAREEKRLGFSGLPCAWSFHVNEATGERHLHAAWYRVDTETGLARDPGLFKLRLKEVSRTCEKEFALREVSNHRQAHDRARVAERKEVEEARRLSTDVRAIRTAILDSFEHSDNGRAFKASLDERGLMLANGDQRDCFVVIDQAGGHHALNKKLTGQTLAEIRTRLADIERAQLPSVEQAKELQAEIAAGYSAPEIQPEQASRRYDPLHATERAVERAQFKGRYDELREAEPPPEVARLFEASAARAAEPPAINFDRDAAEATWLDKIAAAGIAHDAARAAQGSRQPAEPGTGRETRAGAGEPAYAQPQGQEAAREIAPESGHGIRDLDNIGGRIFGSLGKMFASFIAQLADFIAPAPPPTKDQAERAARVADERQEQQAVAAYDRAIQDQHDNIAEQQRTRDIARMLQIDSVGDREEERFRSIMQRASRDRDRDYERER
jgi:hypothetical protein